MNKEKVKSTPTLREIADRINVYLKTFERDPNVNRPTAGSPLKPYWYAGSYVAGRYVAVIYVSFQGAIHLSKSDALIYLEWLDSGNRGKHWQALDASMATKS